jgi:prophage maintenance system killer protein
MKKAVIMDVNKGEIVIYQAEDGTAKLEVRLDQDSIWLTQSQMVLLFERDRSVITKHINNVFKEGELSMISNVHFLHIANSDKPVKLYNLDVVISVGYRVKSLRGTQFRIWANKVLRDYLVNGYVVNQLIQKNQFDELRQTVKLLAQATTINEISAEELGSILQVLTDYTYGLDILDQYDHQQLAVNHISSGELFHATYEGAMEVIHELKQKFGGSKLFGNQKDQSFRSSIATIYQTFNGADLYPSIEEKAAMLLYLVTKNHSFSDGNKRIAAALFLWFMERNGILYHSDGNKRIANNTLAALTLMIAISHPEEMDMMIKVVVNLINRKN